MSERKKTSITPMLLPPLKCESKTSIDEGLRLAGRVAVIGELEEVLGANEALKSVAEIV